ncbi:unnamed protein product [Protopolystoma xenopodis]|uniref:Uncharacterized protein n=1 Tax=Protopolystoma xenopodis TaxID=117903 RepID=A0A3S4ZV23_9PLAT|nr:unnamed protein product [Protopolystoma xenopodis]
MRTILHAYIHCFNNRYEQSANECGRSLEDDFMITEWDNPASSTGIHGRNGDINGADHSSGSDHTLMHNRQASQYRPAVASRVFGLELVSANFSQQVAPRLCVYDHFKAIVGSSVCACVHYHHHNMR